ncbi:zinc finger MYM-type protein 1-like [Chenopodium quinoa]|uniref:zinc finger MYM-type protein 1-like n=1 Tax=Chenopodium quinoa TaxID=63459 RepID=UPI000B78350C|nr:zinc finger MYM-type protein 1-like [Chenopodium quinoa]
MERFLGIVHVSNTTALTLKDAIMSLLVEHSLSPSMIRGQGYDGASNMKGEINGLKTLIMNDTPSAYYVHCFAHQLQLTLVAIAKKNDSCGWLFEILANLLNVVGVSCKRREMIRQDQAEEVARALDVGDIVSGSGLNQELGLKRPGDTRWSSYYKSISNIILLFPTIVKVLVHIGKHGVSEDKFKAQIVLGQLEKEQDIVNAMELVTYTKLVLQKMREQGWDTLLNKVTSFCAKHGIVVPTMDSPYVPQGRSRRFVEEATNEHHFRVGIFVRVIDLHLQELDDRFNERNMEILICMACLSPKDNFSSFDKDKVLKLSSFYPEEFLSFDLMALECQLDIFMENMLNDDRFQGLNDLNSLSMMLVKTNKHKTFPLIHLLIKLMLILPVATASVERVFSAMTCVKNKLRNSMGDQLMNDCLITFIEKDVFLRVSDEKIVDRFQNMKTRRMKV